MTTTVPVSMSAAREILASNDFTGSMELRYPDGDVVRFEVEPDADAAKRVARDAAALAELSAASAALDRAGFLTKAPQSVVDTAIDRYMRALSVSNPTTQSSRI